MHGILERPPGQRPMGSIPDQETKLRNFELDRLHGRLQKDNSPRLQGAYGPVAEYDRRVKSGVLKDDQHQRTIIESLQDLHDMLANYNPPTVQEPSIESLQPKKQGFLSSIFGGGQKSLSNLDIPSDLPKGLYMYGDVGSGKTMMMDLFYDTLPESIQRATRIHFHNFMQEVHRDLHKVKMQYGQDIDAIPFVAAHIAKRSSVLCFDEFQCTDVADAMILRRLVESLMHHGTVIVTTSNRHPTELYKNGVQRESFIPCINLLQRQLRVLNLDSPTDYRKVPRPASGVYHHPLNKAASTHVTHWFKYLGDFENDPPHPAEHHVWGRPIQVPQASGKAAHFDFDELIGRATGAADYIELMRNYDAFIVSNVPQMDHRSRDRARRFITFIDAVYESHAKLVLTTAVPLTELFLSREEVDAAMKQAAAEGDSNAEAALNEGSDVDDVMRQMMDDLGMNMNMLKKSNFFSGDEEAFAFARALSRLSEMGSQMWVERGMGLENKGGKKEKDDFAKVRSRWKEDSM
ncbi:hypothetical protein KCU76_g16712, partial [Aureobasidium melanogenum]